MPLRPLSGRLQTIVVESQHLEGNRLGDTARRDVHVYLPPGYTEGLVRYPVVMALPGFGSLTQALLPKDVFKDSLVERADRLMLEATPDAGGGCGPAILVMPEACTRLGGSQFIDSPVTGMFQSFLADEVFTAVDSEFRTTASAAGRAVVGVSSGGFGALRLALDRPDAVSVAGSIAGDAHFEVSLRPMIPKVAARLLGAGGPARFVEQVLSKGPGSADYDALFFLAAAQAYAPEPTRPFPHVVLPFDPESAALDADTWQRFLSHDPVHRIGSSKATPAELRAIFLEAGLEDEYGLQFAARALKAQLEQHGFVVHHEEFPGGHRGASHRYETLLPKIVATLQASR